MPRTVIQQFGVGSPARDVEAGDLVFFRTAGRRASHVGIAIDGDFTQWEGVAYRYEPIALSARALPSSTLSASPIPSGPSIHLWLSAERKSQPSSSPPESPNWMPHPERACSVQLGNTDGREILKTLLMAEQLVY